MNVSDIMFRVAKSYTIFLFAAAAVKCNEMREVNWLPELQFHRAPWMEATCDDDDDVVIQEIWLWMQIDCLSCFLVQFMPCPITHEIINKNFKRFMGKFIFYLFLPELIQRQKNFNFMCQEILSLAVKKSFFLWAIWERYAEDCTTHVEIIAV